VESLGDGSGGLTHCKIFSRHGAAQCGICTSGMLMAARSFTPDLAPSRAEVEDALGGVLCRCTVRQDRRGRDVGATSVPVAARRRAAVGARLQRVDGVPKVTGRDLFGAMPFRRCLWIRVVRSPHARARFVLGDLARCASAWPPC